MSNDRGQLESGTHHWPAPPLLRLYLSLIAVALLWLLYKAWIIIEWMVGGVL